MGAFSHTSDTFSGAFLSRAPTTEPRSKAMWGELCLLGLRVSPGSVVSSRTFSCSVNTAELVFNPFSPVVQPTCPTPPGPWTGTS